MLEQDNQAVLRINLHLCNGIKNSMPTSWSPHVREKRGGCQVVEVSDGHQKARLETTGRGKEMSRWIQFDKGGRLDTRPLVARLRIN